MDVKAIGNRIKKAREAKNMTLEDVAAEVQIAKSTVQRYETGKIVSPKIPVLDSIAKALGVDPVWLSEGVEPDPSALPPFPDIHPVTLKRYPLFDGIAAGQPILMPDGVETYIDGIENLHADFALIVRGDSMEPRIPDRSIVFVRSQPTVENGQVAVIAVDDSATLKRFYRSDDTVTLVAENPRYPPMIFTAESGKKIRILGRAVYCQIEIT